MRHQTEAAKTAGAIRNKLKSEGVKARVKSENYAGGNAVHVSLIDPTPAVYATVRDWAHDYEIGSFDGMEDCYKYDNQNDNLPQVNFVFVETDYSNDLIEAAKQYVVARTMTPSNEVAQAAYRILRGSKESNFWTTCG